MVADRDGCALTARGINRHTFSDLALFSYDDIGDFTFILEVPREVEEFRLPNVELHTTLRCQCLKLCTPCRQDVGILGPGVRRG